MMITALMMVAAVTVCAGANDAAGQSIVNARAEFNRAIAERDIGAVSAALAETALLVTGTDSIRFAGRQVQVELWKDEFADEKRLIYRRTPDCVTVSKLYPIALESGSWRGAPVEGDGSYVGGRYAAKWRLIEDRWVIESETYLTTECGGALCPAANEQEP